MLDNSLYLNRIDQQLSKIAEGDQLFKQELAAIYAEYMRVIPPQFIGIIRKKDLSALTQLHHKHKTTCYILSLQKLSDIFIKARDILASSAGEQNEEATLEVYVGEVTAICNDTLTQLQEINRS